MKNCRIQWRNALCVVQLQENIRELEQAGRSMKPAQTFGVRLISFVPRCPITPLAVKILQPGCLSSVSNPRQGKDTPRFWKIQTRTHLVTQHAIALFRKKGGEKPVKSEIGSKVTWLFVYYYFPCSCRVLLPINCVILAIWCPCFCVPAQHYTTCSASKQWKGGWGLDQGERLCREDLIEGGLIGLFIR